MKIPNTISHSKSALIYTLAYGFERASYYGMRVLIVLLMVDATLNFSREKALSIYGWFATAIIVSKVFGALFGDLLLGNRTAIFIGGILQALGCFTLSIQTPWSLYLGLGLITLGTGLFTSNTLAQFGKQYLTKPKLLDAGFTWLFVAINLGSFLGVLITGHLGELNFSYGFIAAGILMVIATIFVIFTSDTKENVHYNFKTINLGKNILYIIAVIIMSGIFWAIYELSYIGTYTIQQSIFSSADIIIPQSILATGFGSFFGIIIIIILAIVWTYIYTNSFFKLFIGLIFSALSFAVLLLIPESPNESYMAIFLLSVFLLSAGEMFISPMLFSITTRFSNPKYLAIMLSAVAIPTMLFNKMAGFIGKNIEEVGFNVIFIFSAIILFILGGIAFVLWKVFKPENTIYLSKEAEEFLS